MKESNKLYAALAIIAFGLNWVWEMTQMFAFEIKLGNSRAEVFLFCTLAAVVDTLVTVAVYGLLAQTTTRRNRLGFYTSAAFLGAWCAVFFEWFARIFNLWSYNEKMLRLPLLETGLLPFLQLTLLVPLATWLARRFKKV